MSALVSFQRGRFEETLLNVSSSHLSDSDVSHCVSPMQSFLVVQDPDATQPNLLCVSVGHGDVHDFTIKHSGTGTVLWLPSLGRKLNIQNPESELQKV